MNKNVIQSNANTVGNLLLLLYSSSTLFRILLFSKGKEKITLRVNKGFIDFFFCVNYLSFGNKFPKKS